MQDSNKQFKTIFLRETVCNEIRSVGRKNFQIFLDGVFVECIDVIS